MGSLHMGEGQGLHQCKVALDKYGKVFFWFVLGFEKSVLHFVSGNLASMVFRKKL